LVRWSRAWMRLCSVPMTRPCQPSLICHAHTALCWPSVGGEKSARVSGYFLAWKQSHNGDGPDLVVLKQEYPTVNFLGVLSGENLARHYAGADLFVFPSTPTHSVLCCWSLFRRPACRRHARAGTLGYIRGRRGPGFCRHGSGFRPRRCSSPAIAR